MQNVIGNGGKAIQSVRICQINEGDQVYKLVLAMDARNEVGLN